MTFLSPEQMTMNPKVTVLMSVLNGERYLHEAIESILNQTFKDFEFLIINDGSSDSTREIILSYNDPRISLIDNKKNIGLTRSLNKGLRLAKGEYIARQDADDISLPKRLEEMVNFLDKNREVGLLGNSFIETDDGGKELRTCLLATENGEIKKKLLLENHFGFEMFRKMVVEKVDFYREEFKYAQDYDLALRIAEVSKVANIKEPLYKQRRNPRSISIAKRIEQNKYAELARKLAKGRRIKGKDRLDYLAKHEIKKILPKLTLKEKIEQKHFMSDQYYRDAIRLLENGNKRASLKSILRAIICSPTHYYAWVFLIENFTHKGLAKILGSIKRSLNRLKRLLVYVRIFVK